MDLELGGGGSFSLQLDRAKDVILGSSIEVEDYDPQEHGPLITYEGVPAMEEVDRYWANAPYSFVSINYDPERNENLYHVVEPELNDMEFRLLDYLFDDIRDALIYKEGVETGDPEKMLKQQLEELLGEYGLNVSVKTFYKLFYYLNRAFRGFEKLDPLMHDEKIEDISCNGYGLNIYVYHDEFGNLRTGLKYGKDELDSFVVRLAQQSGHHVSIGNPIVGTTLKDGSRAELSYEQEATPRGSAFTIRKYAEEPFTPVDLTRYGTFDLEEMAYLWLAIENNKSLLFAGGTASGKTTSLNAVSMFIPPSSKIVSIEDTRELTLYHENWLSGVTRERAGEEQDITLFDLLKASLRHRPEYIVVGEVRGPEAQTLFQAMNTGHTTYSTMHADSMQTVIHRLENEPLNVPRAMVQSLDIISIQFITRVGENRVRRNRRIYEIEGISAASGDLNYSTIFSWKPIEDTFSMRRESQIMDEIKEEKGWSRTDMLKERQNRKKVLKYLEESEADAAEFTATINDYQLNPETVIERVEEELEEEPERPGEAGG